MAVWGSKAGKGTATRAGGFFRVYGNMAPRPCTAETEMDLRGCLKDVVTCVVPGCALPALQLMTWAASTCIVAVRIPAGAGCARSVPWACSFRAPGPGGRVVLPSAWPARSRAAYSCWPLFVPSAVVRGCICHEALPAMKFGASGGDTPRCVGVSVQGSLGR